MTILPVETALWVSGVVGHAAVIIMLLRSARWRTFPIFASLMAYELGVSVLLFMASQFGTRHAYFLCYWTLAFVDYVFQLALLTEIVIHVFPRSAKWVLSWSGGLAIWSAIVTIASAIVCLMVSPPGMHGLGLWEERITLFTSLLTCGFYVAISYMSNRFKLQWDGTAIAIGQGLAAWAATAVLGDLYHATFGWVPSSSFTDYIRMGMYILALIYWAWALGKPERQDSLGPHFMEQIVAWSPQVREGTNPHSRERLFP